MPEDDFDINEVPYQLLEAQRVVDDGSIVTAPVIKKGFIQKAVDFVKCKACKDDVVNAVDVHQIPINADVAAIVGDNVGNATSNRSEQNNSVNAEQREGAQVEQESSGEEVGTVPRAPTDIERSMSNFLLNRQSSHVPEGVGAQAVAGIGADGNNNATNAGASVAVAPPSGDGDAVLRSTPAVASVPQVDSGGVTGAKETDKSDAKRSLQKLEEELLQKKGLGASVKSKEAKIDYGIPVDEAKLKLSDEDKDKKPAALKSGNNERISSEQRPTVAQNIINQRSKRTAADDALAKGADDASIDSSQHSR